MRVFLSQIREWVVDFSADLLFISLRTDVAWYRLTKCAALPRIHLCSISRFPGAPHCCSALVRQQL